MNDATTPQTLLDLDNMLNESLDTVPDLPEFANPPAGEYRLKVMDTKPETYKSKAEPEIEKTRIRVMYSILETLSTASGELPVPDGSMFSETFMTTEQGWSFLKSRAKAVLNVADMTGVTKREMLDAIKGQEFTARITIKKSPNPAGGEYENIQIRVVPPKV